jgi:PIN domain nuclease of toxin-antitoxin system
METVIHLDTHVAVWLYIGDRRRLRPIWQTLDRAELVVSPIVPLELQYLFEIGKTTEPAETVLAALVDQFGLRLSAAPFAQVVRHALNQTWTRDPFDRLLVGTALVDHAPLLTRDAHIRRHCKLAKWG